MKKIKRKQPMTIIHIKHLNCQQSENIAKTNQITKMMNLKINTLYFLEEIVHKQIEKKQISRVLSYCKSNLNNNVTKDLSTYDKWLS